jgi:hypothetical protein
MSSTNVKSETLLFRVFYVVTKICIYLPSKSTNSGILIMASPSIEAKQTVSVTSGTDGTKIAAGSTTPGATNWQVHSTKEGPPAIYLDVDTSAASFTTTPVYVTSIGGNGDHWRTTGGSSVYQATPRGFRVYIRWERKSESTTQVLTPEIANDEKWHINWMAFEPLTTKPTPFPDPYTYYYIVAKHSSKGLAVADVSKDDNANIVQWDKVARDNHLFQFQDAGNGYFYIVAKHSNKGIAVADASEYNNAHIVQWDTVARDNHQFKLQDAGNDYFYIVAKHSGKGLAVDSVSKDNNANIVQWDILVKDNHQWKLEAAITVGSALKR